MSLRTFSVFQDAVSSDASHPKVSRPNAMITRSSLNGASSTNATSTVIDLLVLDKENYHPVTGERAGPSNGGSKKRKTSVLATKVQPEPATKSKKGNDSDREPEQKKRRGPTSSTSKGKAKKDVNGSGPTKKSARKPSASRKVSPMPKLDEEEDLEKEHITQSDIDSRCYELTVKPLVDVSQAYEEVPLNTLPLCSLDASDEKAKFCTAKVSSVEPEIRDYFQPSRALFSSVSTSSHMRALSEDISESRPFSTPERKQIYAAFTFSSPSGSSERTNKAPHSGSITPANLP